jgi:plastocyanin
MTIRLSSTVLAAAAVLAVGCGGGAQPVAPSLGPSSSLAISAGESPAGAMAAAIAGGIERAVMLFDACDPATFNAALGPGTCTRSGGVTFQTFLDQLGNHQSVGAWHFAPGVLTMKAGQTLVAINTGGEDHTFTEVEEFGGGIVPVLNTLTHLTTVAPECTQLQPSDFLAPGERSSETEDEEGVEKYQCCIHPWMRAEVRISEK